MNFKIKAGSKFRMFRSPQIDLRLRSVVLCENDLDLHVHVYPESFFFFFFFFFFSNFSIDSPVDKIDSVSL